MADRSKSALASKAPTVSAFPPLYRDPTVLVHEVHAKAGLLPFTSFGFAAKANALPLTVAEFPYASAHYPIVFAPDAAAAPMVVVGLREGENLFVQAWEEAAAAPDHAAPNRIYVPAYARRYPFVIVENAEKNTQVLAVDGASDRFVEDVTQHPKADAFFDAAAGPSTSAAAAMAFCGEFNLQSLLTKDFAKAVSESGILKPRTASVQLPDRSRFALDGFQVVDEAAFKALPDATLIDWHRKNWLSLVTLHLASQRNWLRFVDLAQDRKQSA